MKKAALLALLTLPCCLFAAEEQRTLKGVSLPAAMQLDGARLRLNGMGLRTKVVFKVYVAGLYLEKPSADGLAIAASDQVKRMELVFLRGVDGPDVAAAIAEGFANNAGDALPRLGDRVAKLRGLIPDVKKGDRLVFVYKPGGALQVSANGKALGAVEGKDFADTLFKVWLGEKPADKALKQGLLGL